MDRRLADRLNEIDSQLEKLRQCEMHFLDLEAHRKVLAAQLFIKADGRSVAEREAQVYSSQEWIDFSGGHAQAETEFNHERRRYELLLKAYDAEHLTLKTETPVIRRQA